MNIRKLIKIVIILNLLIIIIFIKTFFYEEKESFEENLKNQIDSTVFIKCEADSNNTGTGIVVDNRGYIATALHVVPNCEKILIHFIDDFGTPIRTYYAKKIEIKNLTFDVALLKIEPFPDHKMHSSEIADPLDIKIGNTIAFTGFPYASSLQKGDVSNPFILLVSKGIISGKYTDPGLLEAKYYVINAFLNLGDSGGPVFLEKNNKVIGVVKGPILPLQKVPGLQLGQVLVNPLHDIPPILNKLES